MRWLPLLPPWLVGLWLLVSSDGLWDPASLGSNLQGSSMAAGWMLLGTLVVATAAYAGAPALGRKLAVSTNSSMLAGLGTPNGSQESLGAGLVRAFALFGSYVVVAAMALA